MATPSSDSTGISLPRGFATSIMISRGIVSPIHRLLDTVKQIDQGKLNARVQLKEQNEFRLLADHFNRMTANLSDKDARLRDKITTLEILSGGIAHEIRNPLGSIGQETGICL